MKGSGLWVLVAGLALPLANAQASVPLRTPLQGMIRDNAGVPVADAAFQVAFSLYASAEDGVAVWSEMWPPGGADCQVDPGPCVKVEDGRFSVVLGFHEPLNPDLFFAGPLWLGMSVEGEPELPRRPLGSSPTAVVAAVAAGLDCTGCVGAEHLDPAYRQGILDDAAAMVPAVAAGLDCTGCVGAEHLDPAYRQGILDDAAADVLLQGFATQEDLDDLEILETDLPLAGLDDVSNDLLTNEFLQDYVAPVPVPIEDDWPPGIESTIEVPDVGFARTLSVSANVTNSDTSTLRLTLTDPEGVEYLLWDGNAPGTEILTMWPDPEPVVSGDLGAWTLKNPAGTWTLKVVDFGFLNQLQDGELVSWKIRVELISSKRVHANFDLSVGGELTVFGGAEISGPLSAAGGLQVYSGAQVDNGMIVNGGLQVGQGQPGCDPSRAGSIQFDPALQRLIFCDGQNTLVLKACDTACDDPATVACGEPTKNGCDDPCPAAGTSTNTTECLVFASNAACGVPVSDSCGNDCGLQGAALDATTCPDPFTVPCGSIVSDACGNHCGQTGVAPNAALCPAATTVGCGLPVADTCDNPCGEVGTSCPGTKDVCEVGGCSIFGQVPSNSGLSCADIVQSKPGASDGLYWVDRDGPGGGDPIQVTCDMTTDGGGWMLVDIPYLKDHAPFGRTTNAPGGDSAAFVNGDTIFYGYPNNHDYEIWYDFELGISYTEIHGLVRFYPSANGVGNWTTDGANPDNEEYGGISGDTTYSNLGIGGEGGGNKSWHRWGKPGQVFHAVAQLGWTGSPGVVMHELTFGPTGVVAGSKLRWSGFSESGDPPRERWAFSPEMYIR